jgi:hypothetical protein
VQFSAYSLCTGGKECKLAGNPTLKSIHTVCELNDEMAERGNKLLSKYVSYSAAKAKDHIYCISTTTISNWISIL